ncbi:PAAR domain-containing protein [Pseudoduganella sp. R-32]|uniref:PAAR domain-containing protein n=1 Tax=Pseudoduganella sp. R-32 TaxID=3404061 RepID=UPI003CED9305
MKNSKGKGVIRLGDTTSHGGKIIMADPTFKVLGKPIACEGHMTMCPKCRGMFPVKVGSSERKHKGKAVAYEGDQAACGAKLISSI